MVGQKARKEIFYIDDLISDFRIQEVQKAGAIFDPAKLDWINNNHIAALSFAEFKPQLLPFLDKQSIDLDSRKIVMKSYKQCEPLSQLWLASQKIYAHIFLM